LAADGWTAPVEARGGVEFFVERLVGRESLQAVGAQ
jgi:hypothetical protein